MNIRLIKTLPIIALMALASCKTQGNFLRIGQFETTIDGRAMVFPSYRDLKHSRGGIKVTFSEPDMIIFFNGLAGKQSNGAPDLPMLAVTFKSNPDGSNIRLASVILHKKIRLRNISNLYYRSGEDLGKQKAWDLQIDDAGNASFKFSAQLVRINTDSNTPIEAEAPLHIEGSYNGKIPQAEFWK
jgi:hypothetical protein